MDNAFTIAGREISDQQPPFIIAELSGNHGQNFKVAEQMIIAAANAGVDAVKLQTYTADTITFNSDKPDFQIKEASNLWRGQNLYNLYDKAHTPWEWHRDLFLLAKEHGLIIFSSPFDESSVDFLEALNTPCYKIASFELTHFPLLRKVAETGKPVIMSTGMASLAEIEQAVEQLSKYGCQQLALLQCTSCYPAPIAEANLQTMIDMKQRFKLPVGLSDHSRGIAVSIVAAALGAAIIERHFVLNAESDAVDAAFSSTAEEFSNLVKDTQELATVVGSVSYGPGESEQDSLGYRRSIYVVEDIQAGEVFSEKNIKVIRPGYGLSPKFWDSLLGETAQQSIAKGTALSWAMVANIGPDGGLC